MGILTVDPMDPSPRAENWDLHVRESGRGSPLVLVHGWATSSAVWAGLVDRLSRAARCLAVDLPGHGSSPLPREPISIGDYAAGLVRLVARRELARPTLMGWSMGAQVALEAAALLGDRLAGLILVAGTARFSSGPGYPHGLPPAEVEALAARLERNPQKALRRFFAGMFADGELSTDERRRWTEELTAAAPDVATTLAALSALTRFDARSWLPSIRVPVLLFHGERDPIVPASASAYLAGRLPRARVEMVAAAGHAPLLGRADRLCESTTAFLRESR